MFERQICHALLVFTFVLSIFVDQSQAIFYIVKYNYYTYAGRLDYVPQCWNYYDYDIYSNQPGLPNDGREQGCIANLGKWEAQARGDGSNIGNCQYGDYTGLGNNWAFCPTGYGGNLYLNGYHKVCVSADWLFLASCPGLDCPGGAWTAEIICYDDTWYYGA